MGHARCGDCVLRPAIDGIFPLLWSGQGKHRIGEVICETYWLDGSSQNCCPRYVARKQVEKLAEKGLFVQSSCECEFIMMKQSNNDAQLLQPDFMGSDFCSTLLFSEREMFFCEVDTKLKAADIDIEAFHTENAIDQYEIILRPRFGMASCDQVFRLREYLKEIAIQHGFKVSFMTKHEPDSTTGLHFNHSLWNSSNYNVFHDASDPNGLSLLAQHWIGGLTFHAAALTALCSPTVNCYRRLHRSWMPTVGNWGIDDRLTSYRVKNLSPSATYVENRLPGGSANPYLVFAATIAAGLDGITRKIPCPAEKSANAAVLPRTLSEALEALENDKAMVTALGEEFVRWFVTMKRGYELSILKDSKVDNNADDVSGFAKENLMYFNQF